MKIYKYKNVKKSGKLNSIPAFQRDHLRCTSGVICGSGSFAVQFGDHFSRSFPNNLKFNGGWWSGHSCHLTKGKDINKVRKKRMEELLTGGNQSNLQIHQGPRLSCRGNVRTYIQV